MKRAGTLSTVGLCALFGLLVVPAGAQVKEYASPDGAYAVSVPADWPVNRVQLGDKGWATNIGTEGAAGTALTFLAFTIPAGQSVKLDEAGPQLLQLLLGLVQQEGTVTSQKSGKDNLAGQEAIRLDLAIKPKAAGPVQKAWFYVLVGKRFLVAAGASGPEADAVALKKAEAALATFALEGEKPRSGAPAPAAGGFSQEALTSLAQKVQSNFKREKADKVLAEGNPPLTWGSVAAFAGILGRTFGAELTETEFEETARYFTTYYVKGDATTKTMLATGWQQILSQLSEGSAEDQARKVKEVRNVFEQRFAAGAATIPWAATINAAIQKRTTTVASVRNAPARLAKPEYKTQMSQADLDAAMEMLYFMWIASGRDQSAVTPQAVATIRAAIIQNFSAFPPQLQVLFANAQKVYAVARAEWAQATPQHRREMARAFGLALDDLGLTDPRDQTIHASGAWSDMNGKKHSDWAAEMVVGLAGSSYHNAWTSH